MFHSTLRAVLAVGLFPSLALAQHSHGASRHSAAAPSHPSNFHLNYGSASNYGGGYSGSGFGGGLYGSGYGGSWYGGGYIPYASGFYGGAYSTGSAYFGRYGYNRIFPGNVDSTFPAVAAPRPTGSFLPPLAGNRPAALTVSFPAPAIVSLDGKDVPGDPAAERILLSPLLEAGDWYTFRIAARWQVGGQAYICTREVSVLSGGRSRILVMSGTPVAFQK